MNNRSEIKNFIIDLEQKFPVDQWRIDDIHLWPILRTKLFLLLISLSESSLLKDKRKDKPKDKLSKNPLLRRIQSNYRLKKLSAKRQLSNLKQVDILFACASIYRANHNRKSVEKFADPILDAINTEGLIIEHSLKHLYDVEHLYKPKRVHFLYDFMDYVLFSPSRKERLSRQKDFELKQYAEFLACLSSIDNMNVHIDSFSIDALDTLMNRFYDFVSVYDEILDRTKPKVIFSICFYSFPVYAINYIANKRNIKTVEIQHGPQSDVHMSYSSWTKIPDNGFNVMPKIYWSWDTHSHGVLSNWINSNDSLSCFIGGNPWADKFKDITTEKRNIVLYSLQNLALEHLFPNHLIEIIKETEGHEWWLRLHPRQFEYLNDILSFFKERGILHKVNIEKASHEPLPKILNRTKVHITNYSGCVLEAADFNVPSIIIDQRGYDAFKGIIEQGKARYVDSIEAFKLAVDHYLNQEHVSQKDKTIINYQELVERFI